VGRPVGGSAADATRYLILASCRFGLDLDWTVVALALAGLELAAACWAAQRRDGKAENELVLAAYAVGVLGCTILAAVFVLENAWLTVALALHLPALAGSRAACGCLSCAMSRSASPPPCSSG
jgi:hypothetical protein